MTTYGIWCEVWNGVTGAREAWLKSHGKVITFNTREEADAEAKRILGNLSRFSEARYRYTARALNGE